MEENNHPHLPPPSSSFPLAPPPSSLMMIASSSSSLSHMSLADQKSHSRNQPRRRRRKRRRSHSYPLLLSSALLERGGEIKRISVPFPPPFLFLSQSFSCFLLPLPALSLRARKKFLFSSFLFPYSPLPAAVKRWFVSVHWRLQTHSWKLAEMCGGRHKWGEIGRRGKEVWSSANKRRRRRKGGEWGEREGGRAKAFWARRN